MTVDQAMTLHKWLNAADVFSLCNVEDKTYPYTTIAKLKYLGMFETH